MSTSKRPLAELIDGQEDEIRSPRPSKRRTTTQSLPLSPRNAPLPSPPPFQQPVQLLSFSYTSQPVPEGQEPTRTLEWNDASLRYYVSPPNGADLAHGYERWVRRPEERPRLDGLLAACVRRECAATRAAAGVITWRGVVAKILTAPYEEREGWALNVMRVNGTLYLEEHLTEERLREKTDLEGRHRLMTYYGYAFESYCTADAPGGTRPANGWGGDVDTNVQWCSVVKTKLGNTRLLIGGEVDCVRDRYTGQPDTFVELKTTMAIRPGNPHDAAKFEKKLLKFHIQSFLLGVPEIVVGFRSHTGRVQTVQTFRTLDLPRLVRGKRDAWDPAVCLAWGARAFEFLRQTLEDAQDENDSQEMVWRATFTPAEGITVERLDAAEVEAVKGGEDRVGFLPRHYWDELRAQGKPEAGAKNQKGAQHEVATSVGGDEKDGKPKPAERTRQTAVAVTQVQGWQL